MTTRRERPPLTDAQWKSLGREAEKARKRAHAPYSNYRVGAALLTSKGVIHGCNVENASYGLGLCAECGMVSALRTSGGGRLVAVVCTDGEGNLLTPCGRCRQILFEFGGPDLLVNRTLRMADDLLPGAFGPDDLPGR